MICGSPWPPSDNAQGGFNDLPTRRFGSIHLWEGQGAQTITLKLMSLLTGSRREPTRGRKRVVSVFDAVLSTSCFRKMDSGWLFTPASKCYFRGGKWRSLTYASASGCKITPPSSCVLDPEVRLLLGNSWVWCWAAGGGVGGHCLSELSISLVMRKLKD